MLDRLFLGSSAVDTDPNFDYVTLLLPGNGSNGAQNNTFLDASTNNFTITRNGDTTQGSFSPYGDLWSNYFDGTGDYLSIPNNAAFQFGSGDFTIEAWIYLTAYSKNYSGAYSSAIFSCAEETSRGPIWSIGGTASSYTSFGIDRYPVTGISASYNFQLNTWYYVTQCRQGNNWYTFVNGILLNTTSNSEATPNSTGTAKVGRGYTNSYNYDFPGYISNLRVVKGTALYTSNFTPPTAPLTAITNTSLLTCQSNRFRDASTNNFAITRNGDVRVTNFAPFNPSAAYSPAVNGGSAYFDNNGDSLSTPNSTALDFGTGDFTVEAWVYLTQYNTADYQPVFSNAYLFYIGGVGQVLLYNGSSEVFTGMAAGDVPINAWTHIAWVRSGSGTNNTKIYVNGVQKGQATLTASVGSGNPNRIGQYSTVYFPGFIANLRAVKGTALYTSNFTPPTAPLTAISGTSLLLNFTNAGIVDASAKNDLTTVGNAQISTAQSKFGGSSMAFDGTGDYLIGQSTPDLTLGTGDFTIEFWAYINAQGNYCFYDQRTALNQVLPTIYTQAGQIRYYVSGADRITGSTLSAGQWYHIALTRSGTSTRLFVNGTQVGSTYTDANNYIQSRPVIGAVGDGLANYNLNGYIDDLRITKGVARYTANFTPPAAPFPVQ